MFEPDVDGASVAGGVVLLGTVAGGGVLLGAVDAFDITSWFSVVVTATMEG